jgi:hypothetical protein
VKKKQSFFHSLMSLEGERLIGLAEAEGHLFGAKVFLKKIKINIRIIKSFHLCAGRENNEEWE